MHVSMRRMEYLQVLINPGSESVLIDDVLIIKRVGTLKAIETWL